MNRVLAFWLALLMVFGGLTLLWIGWNSSSTPEVGSSSEPDPQVAAIVPPPGSDAPILNRYTLTERSGKSFDSEDMRGQVHVVSFFFSNCPHACLTMNKRIKQLQKELGPLGVKFVSITCDPDTDTPDRLRDYARTLEADEKGWQFLTGDLLYTRRIGAEIYGVAVAKESHTEKLVVVDRQGRVAGRFSWQDADELANMDKTIHRLLAEQYDPSTEPPKPASDSGKTQEDSEDKSADAEPAVSADTVSSSAPSATERN